MDTFLSSQYLDWNKIEEQDDQEGWEAECFSTNNRFRIIGLFETWELDATVLDESYSFVFASREEAFNMAEELQVQSL